VGGNQPIDNRLSAATLRPRKVVEASFLAITVNNADVNTLFVDGDNMLWVENASSRNLAHSQHRNRPFWNR
jgi:hypothetical protein